MKENGKRLRELRESKNMSQAELAKVFGKSQVAISKYENGNRQLDYEMLNKYSIFFDVSTDYLLGRVSDQKEYYLAGDLLPDIMKPLAKMSSYSYATLKVDKPDINATDEEKKRLVEEALRRTDILAHKEELSDLITLLPKEMQNKSMSIYDLYYYIGNNKEILEKLYTKGANFEVDLPRTEQNELPPEAQKELENFREYLIAKYKNK